MESSKNTETGLPLVGGPFCGLIYDVADNVVIIEESVEGTDRTAEYHRMTGSKGDVTYQFQGTHPNGDLIEPGVWWSDDQRLFVVEVNCKVLSTGTWELTGKSFESLTQARAYREELWKSQRD
jgi:hypothetical protein